MVVFDSSVLLLLLQPNASSPVDPDTGEPVESAKERVKFLLQRLENDGIKIIIPTPALAEVLVYAGQAGAEYLDIFNGSMVFRIESFDERAAVELAAMTAEALAGGDKFGGSDAPWQKVKFDRQIMAIARVAGATTIYSDDKSLRGLATDVGADVIGVGELPLPPQKAQRALDLGVPDEQGESEG